MEQFVYILVQPKIETELDESLLSEGKSEAVELELNNELSTNTNTNTIPDPKTNCQIIKVKVDGIRPTRTPNVPKKQTVKTIEVTYTHPQNTELPKHLNRKRKSRRNNAPKYAHFIKPCMVRLNRVESSSLPLPLEKLKAIVPIVPKIGKNASEILDARSKSDGKFKCEQCPRTFTLKGNLKRHLSVNHPSTIKNFPCEQPNCKLSFRCQDYLQSHIQKVHRNLLLSPDADPPAPIECEICGKPFNCKQYMINHRRSHNGKLYTCQICNKEFTKEVYLYIHRKGHLGKKSFACSFCGKVFATKQNLNSHVQIHTGEKKLKCKICGQAFRHYSTLNIHKTEHEGEKSFDCTEDGCGAKFIYYSKLKEHKKSFHSTVLVTIKTKIKR